MSLVAEKGGEGQEGREEVLRACRIIGGREEAGRGM